MCQLDGLTDGDVEVEDSEGKGITPSHRCSDISSHHVLRNFGTTTTSIPVSNVSNVPNGGKENETKAFVVNVLNADFD